MVGFIVWVVIAIAFILFGIYSFFSKKPVGFWANTEMDEVIEIQNYNRAVGKMWCVFGLFFLILGFPLLKGQNSPYILISVVGVVVEVIVLMLVYSQLIEKKYCKK